MRYSYMKEAKQHTRMCIIYNEIALTIKRKISTAEDCLYNFNLWIDSVAETIRKHAICRVKKYSDNNYVCMKIFMRPAGRCKMFCVDAFVIHLGRKL